MSFTANPAARARPRANALAPAVLLAAAAPLAAQDARRVGPSQPAAWFSYAGDHALPAGAPTALHLETQVRRVGPFDEAQQLLLRGAVVRTLRPGVRVAAGYGYIVTWPYGEAPVAARFPEHRAFQQLALAHDAGPVGVQHRYRLEQRWVGVTGVDAADPERVADWRYTNRARYLLRGTLPLVRDAAGTARVYGVLADEVFVNFGRAVANNVFDQNRAQAALGVQIAPALRLEAGYQHQYLVKASGRDVERNHTLVVTLFSAAPFGR